MPKLVIRLKKNKNIDGKIKKRGRTKNKIMENKNNKKKTQN